MKPMPLTPRLSVAPQLTESDLEEAARAGFRTVLSNRPDGESPDQPSNATLAATARRLGLEFLQVPVVSGQLTDDQIEAMKTALAEAEAPVLAFCRTGTRSTMLWALASAGELAPEAIIRTAAEAGFNLEAIRPRLEATARASQSGA
jgi:sulfide:quinone oxidoreductase